MPLSPRSRAPTVIERVRLPAPVSPRPAPGPPPSPHADVDRCIELLRGGNLLNEAQIRFVCEKLVEVLLSEGNIRSISAPVTVVGDVHGQYYDVLELFKIGGDIPDTNYLFLGDYVDRGKFSLETISLLACLKLRYPNRVTLLRGNHESRQTTMAYGFYAECMARYKKPDAWKAFTDMFDYLPLSALIDGRIFAVHGGLSPALHTLDQIRVLDRFHEVPFKGPICDLMWGDPDPSNSGFRQSTRGAGYTFGKDVVEKFLHFNGLNLILRSHQLCHEGYQVLFDNKFATVWSAPNYCYRMKNLASILEIGSGPTHDLYFNVFSECPVHVKQQKGLQPPPLLSAELEQELGLGLNPALALASASGSPGGVGAAIGALNALTAMGALPRSPSTGLLQSASGSPSVAKTSGMGHVTFQMKVESEEEDSDSADRSQGRIHSTVASTDSDSDSHESSEVDHDADIEHSSDDMNAARAEHDPDEPNEF